MKKYTVLSLMFLLFVAVLVIVKGPANAQTPTGNGIYRGVSTAVQFDVSPPLRDIAPLEIKPQAIREIPELPTGLEGPLGPQDIDPLVQSSIGPNLIPAPLVSFDGPSNIASVSPPDPVGDVGPNHYVAMSNLYFAIYDKTGTLLFGPAANNTLWAGFGGPCQNENSGDPIVLHDQISDRWMLSQFTSAGPTYYNCVAVSTTPDPTGSYYRWAFSTGSNFPDYPKYGFWSDALYISTREFAGSSFAGIGAYAVNRAQLIAGNPTPTVISFLATPGSAGGAFNIGDGLLPTDLDGATLPPAGTPNFFVGSMDNGGPYGAPQDALTLWKFTADFVTPANSTFVLANTIPVAAFDSMFPCSPGSRDCIPQPGTSTKIDILSYRQRPMWRLAYRNFGSHEALVTNQSVEATANMAGMRWWEIRDPNGTPVIYQEGTYAPGSSDGIHRWMGSIAMDNSGNMAFGYSASDATTTFPSAWYTGRLASDPLGTMSQGEASIINGTGSQTGSARWGDYTSMNIDPVDDCTFWYVNQYIPTTSPVGWRLRIGAFKFDQCGQPDFTLSATPDNLAICAGTDALYTINVGSVQGYDDPVTLNASGHPAPSTADFSVNPVIPPGSSELTIGNTGAAAAGSYNISVVGVAPTSTHTTTVQLNLFDGVPGAPTLLTPADASTNIPITPDFTWNAVSGAVSYHLELADDINFTNIIYTADVAGTSHTLPGANALPYNTWHYWRVTASNPCGGGATSAEFRFRTVEQPATFCATPNLSIPDNNPTGASHTMNIPTSANILDVDIYVKATHTWVGDLRFVVNHNATNATIIDRPGVPASTFGCSGDNYDVTVNDEGPDGNIETQCANNPAIFGDRVGGDPPNSSLLAAYDGMDISGDWTITVSDLAGGDTGTLVEWCVVPTLEAAGGGVDLSPDQDASGAPGSVVVYSLTITNTGGVSDTFDLAVDAQWPTELSASSISLDAGAVGSFTAAVTVPGNAAAGEQGLSLVTAVSQSDPSVSDDSFLTTTATELRDVALSADPDALSGEPGDVVTYTLTITNTGNGTDTFNLSLSGETWLTNLEPVTVTLAAGEATAVTVVVQIPGDAANGAADTVTVTAVSDADNTVSATVDLTTTATVPLPPLSYIYLPIILKP